MSDDEKLVEEEKDEKPKKKKSKAKSKVVVYKVVDGKAITSKKGILSGGRIVTDDCFPGGKKTLDALVESGCVVAK